MPRVTWPVGRGFLGPIFDFGRIFQGLYIIFYHRDPQPKAITLRRNTRFEPLTVVIGLLVWLVGVSKNTKKDRTQKSNGKCPPYADPHPVVPHQPNFACGVVSRISFLVSSFVKIGWKCGSCGGRNFGLPIDLAHRLYNCLLLPHKPW